MKGAEKMKIDAKVQSKINEALKKIEEANKLLEQAKKEVLSIEYYLEQ